MRGCSAFGVIVLVGVAGCRCGSDKPATQPPPPAAKDAAVVAPVAPITDAESQKAIACIFAEDPGRSREVFTVIGENLAPAPLIRRAVETAITRAKEDGETPFARVLSDAVDAYNAGGDRAGLAATFKAIDALSPETNGMLFSHHGPQRMRAGLPVEKKDFAGDELEITRERALAGDKAGAARFYDDVAVKSTSSRGPEEKVGALVAIDRIADAKAVIASAKEEDRLKITGAWLDVALRQPGTIDEALQVVLAELAKAPDRAVTWFGVSDAFRRAARLGRGRDLAPLYKALKARYEKEIKDPQRRLEINYELAAVVGDTEDLRAFEKEPGLAKTLAARSQSIEAALAKAKAEKHPIADYARIWLRATTQPVPPGFGATLIKTICPADLGPPKPAAPPLAGAKLVAKEKSRGMRQECALHDVVVTLSDASGKKLGTETIDGECTGACTAAEQREGQKALDEIQKRIDDGDASQSETDYNFTDCMFRGPDEAETEEVAGRKLVLIPIHGIGPHDVPNTSYQIAIEVCGALHVLESFGEMYAHHWEPTDLELRESADKSQIIIDGKSSFYTGVVGRITLPGMCPTVPGSKRSRRSEWRPRDTDWRRLELPIPRRARITRMPISCYEEEASLFDDGTVAARTANCFDDETGEWVGQTSGMGYSNQSSDDISESRMWVDRNEGTWLDENGNPVTGTQWSGAVADNEVMLSGDPNSTEVGSYFGVDDKLLAAEAECIQSEDGQSLSAQTTLIEGGVQWGTTGTDEDTHNRVAVSAGDGQAVRFHDGDRDHDGRPEYGVGFDIGPVAVDQTSEDPLGTVYDQWFSGFGDMTDEDENLTESVVGPPVQRGAPKTFDQMNDTELTVSALFNDGMKPERRREILGGKVEAITNLFGGMF